MRYEIVRRQSALLALALCLIFPVSTHAQRGQRGPQAPQTPKASAPFDITGTRVSVITEDCKYRMLSPRKGDYDGVPGTFVSCRPTKAWDPTQHEAAGEACKG